MAKDLYLDPDGLTAANNKIREVHGDLSAAFETLRGILDEHHGCWGDDDIGKAFEQNYAPPETQIRDGSEQTLVNVDDLVTSFETAIADFQAQDEENANSMKND